MRYKRLYMFSSSANAIPCPPTTHAPTLLTAPAACTLPHARQAGAIQQLSKSQATCGVELGLLLVEALTQDQVEPEGEALQGVCDMLRALPPPASRSDICARDSAAGQTAGQTAGPSEDDTALEEYARLVAAAAKWAAGKGKCSPAACQIHDIFGAYLMQQHGLQQLGRATQHFARGSQPKEYAKGACLVAHPACGPQRMHTA